MRKSLCLVLLCSFVALAAVKVDHDWPEFSIAAENARLDLLGVVLTEPGNAAEIYGPYLKDEAPILKNEIWEKLKGVSYENLDEPKSQEILTQALAAAKDDLAAIKKASRMKDYELWGKVMQLDKEKDIIAQPFPSFVNLMIFGKLLAAESRRLDQAGDEKAALDNLMALARMGRQVSRDPLAFGFMVGVALKSQAAGQLAAFHERHGRQDAAANWRLYEDLCQTTTKGWKKFNGLDTAYSEDQVKELLLNEDIPFSLRFEMLTWRHYCVSGGMVDFGTLKCIVTDTPDYILQIEDELAKRDPLYKMFIDILKAHKPSDVMGFREWLAAP